MAKLSREEVEHIAKLSKLELSPEEKERYSEQLSSVLEYINLLAEVDVEGVESTNSVTGLSNVMSKDHIEESNISYEDIELNAPEFDNGFFVVPGVFSGEEKNGAV